MVLNIMLHVPILKKSVVLNGNVDMLLKLAYLYLLMFFPSLFWGDAFLTTTNLIIILPTPVYIMSICMRNYFINYHNMILFAYLGVLVILYLNPI